jgi:CheY-like chemotaxis protein
MRTILQVEDDPNDVFFLQHAMKKVGVANPIQVVTDGQQAIDYLRGAGKFADRAKFAIPSLVLLDLKLPYVMGLDVLKWIRQQPGPSLPVIIMTASAEAADIRASYDLGANAFLTKPSEASKLDDIARSIKDFWLTHNILPQESYQERMPAPAPAATNPAVNRRLPNPANVVSPKQENTWRLDNSKKTYGNDNGLSL